MSSKHQTSARIKYDYLWIDKQSFLTRLAVDLFRRQINIIAKHVLTTAFERSAINSTQLHELAAIVDRILYPVKATKNIVVQENITCGGDCAGGDIYK